MTLKELYETLVTTELPVAYDYFPEAAGVEPPCITYNTAYTNNFGADDKVYQKVQHIDIHLYTKGKDTESEEALEKVLDDASLFWQSTEVFEDTEEINHITYEVEI